MRITFGWSYDGAHWSETNSTDTVITGQAGLADILANKLGLTAVSRPQVARTVAYRAALSEFLEGYGRESSGEAWFGPSFKNGSWKTSKYILKLRDELRMSGWNFDETAVSSGGLKRLQAVAQIEKIFRSHPEWSPSIGDMLVDIRDELQDLISEIVEASTLATILGIERITVLHDQEMLPLLWRDIFGFLGELVEYSTDTEKPKSLKIISVSDEWEAATVGAKYLADHAEMPHTIVAGATTSLLDAELQRHGIPAAMVLEGDPKAPHKWVLKKFLEAVSGPFNVSAIEELTRARFAGTSRLGDEEETEVFFLPRRFGNLLREAFSNEFGVGGAEWEHAKSMFFDGDPKRGIEKPSPAATEVVTGFLNLIENDPLQITEDGFETAELAEATTWFRERLKTMNRHLGSAAVSEALQSALNLQTLLPSFGSHIKEAELQELFKETHASGTNKKANPQVMNEAGVWKRTDSVASLGALGLGTNPVLWWIPADDFNAHKTLVRVFEKEYMKNLGFQIPEGEKLNSLAMQSIVQALATRGSVTLILPNEVTGEKFEPHPALSFIAKDFVTSETKEIKDVLEAVSVKTKDIFPAETLGNLTPVALKQLNPIEHRFTGGEHLLPSRISYSQWQKLLDFPFEWLLEKIFKVKENSTQHDNQIIGKWLHEVINQLVAEAFEKGTKTVTPSESEIFEKLQQLLPVHASMLNLPGRKSEREMLLHISVEVISNLFLSLSRLQFEFIGTEKEIDSKITLPGGRDVKIIGFVDAVLRSRGGHTVVIDLKYTNNSKTFEDKVALGTPLQLAVYAYGMAEQGESMDRVPIAYYMLKDGAMLTDFEEFGVPTVNKNKQTITGFWGEQKPTTSNLFTSAKTGLEMVFEGLQEGHLVSSGNKTYLDNQKQEIPDDTSDAALGWLRDFSERGLLNESKNMYPSLTVITGLKRI